MKLITFLFFIFLSNTVIADDIFDFQIEGMSIGDSALSFFTKDQILNNSMNYYVDKKYTPVQNDGPLFFKNYDAVDFNFKTNDPEIIIQSLGGIIFFDRSNINACIQKMDQILFEMKKIFQNNAVFHDKKKHFSTNDPTGGSYYIEAFFELKSGSVFVTCYDYSVEDGGQDHLGVFLDTHEFTDWIRYEAYTNKKKELAF